MPIFNKKIKYKRRDASGSGSYLPSQIAERYSFPAGYQLWNRRLAIVELGGSYSSSTVYTYCRQFGYQLPRLRSFTIDGQGVISDGPDGADGEVQLDIEVAAAVCPGLNIDIYFAPNTIQGFSDGIAAAARSGVDAISISWGAPEDSYTESDRALMESALASSPIPIFAAMGDNGATDGTDIIQVDYPASSQYSIGVGGTYIVGPIGSNGEIVWNDSAGVTGGGFSASTGRPSYQEGYISNNNYRSCPDLAANASPNSGYVVNVDGTNRVIGGTSAAAPLLACLYILIISRLDGAIKNADGSAPGFIEALYHFGAGWSVGAVPGVFTDITEGSNGFYAAQTGFDQCTGLGVPNGEALLAALAKSLNVTPKPPDLNDPNPVTPPPLPWYKALLRRLLGWM